MSWLKDALTEINGKVFDLKRISAATFVVGFHVNEVYAVFWRHVPFDMAGYTVAVAGMLTAIGGTILLGRTGEQPMDRPQ